MNTRVYGYHANTIDEHAARMCAGLVATLAILSLWAPLVPLIAFLAVDFTIRGFLNAAYSPLRWVSRSIVGVLYLEPKPVYAPPKRFAAQMGATLAILATLLRLTGPRAGAEAVTLLLVAAASLESIAGFCLGCWIYPFVFKLRGDRHHDPAVPDAIDEPRD